MTGTTAAPIVPAVAYAQLEAIRDQWLAPLVERIGELEREAGRLTAERDALERERDQLRQSLERAETARPTSTTPNTTEALQTPQRRSWRLWEAFRRRP